MAAARDDGGAAELAQRLRLLPVRFALFKLHGAVIRDDPAEIRTALLQFIHAARCYVVVKP